MDRQTQYPYEVPAETDFLSASRFAYEALGLLTRDLLGASQLVAGLACTPTSPASMQVQVGPGRIYSLQNLEDSAWGVLSGVGGLPVDTNVDHQLIKQGLYRDKTALAAFTAPGTAGQSINYLIQAAFSEVDAIPTSLPFVSSTPPYAPIAPSTLNTVRQNKCVITVKAGAAAATGSQTTPAVDSGNVGLWVVTVPNGATSITSGNISAYSGAPFISETLGQKISQATGDARYLQLSNMAAWVPGQNYIKFQGGLYLQWMSYSIPVSSTVNMPSPVHWGNATVTHGFTFPTGTIRVWTSPFVDTDGQLACAEANPINASSSGVYAASTTSGSNATGTLFALGY